VRITSLGAEVCVGGWAGLSSPCLPKEAPVVLFVCLFCFFNGTGLELSAYTLSHSTSPFL
jgi:hypothetical protein